MRTIATPRCQLVASDSLQGNPIKIARLLKASSTESTQTEAAVRFYPSSRIQKDKQSSSSSTISTRRNTSSRHISQTPSAAAATPNPRSVIVKATRSRERPAKSNTKSKADTRDKTAVNFIHHKSCNASVCVVARREGTEYFTKHKREPFEVQCDECDTSLHPCCTLVLASMSPRQIHKDSFRFVCEDCMEKN